MRSKEQAINTSLIITTTQMATCMSCFCCIRIGDHSQLSTLSAQQHKQKRPLTSLLT